MNGSISNDEFRQKMQARYSHKEKGEFTRTLPIFDIPPFVPNQHTQSQKTNHDKPNKK